MMAVAEVKVCIKDLVESKDTVICVWTREGTNSGPGGTGKPFRISGAEQWRTGGDGMLAESLGNFAAAEYRRQVEHGVDGRRAGRRRARVARRHERDRLTRRRRNSGRAAYTPAVSPATAGLSGSQRDF
jgi:hypothetical protein